MCIYRALDFSVKDLTKPFVIMHCDFDPSDGHSNRSSSHYDVVDKPLTLYPRVEFNPPTPTVCLMRL